MSCVAVVMGGPGVEGVPLLGSERLVSRKGVRFIVTGDHAQLLHLLHGEPGGRHTCTKERASIVSGEEGEREEEWVGRGEERVGRR